MEEVLLVFGTYLSIGFAALCLLDLLTHRIRNRLSSSAVEAQTRLIVSGQPTGNKTAWVLIILALWIFWPLAIYSAISSQWKGDDNGEEKQRTTGED